MQVTQVRPPEHVEDALKLLFQSARAGRGREFSSDAVFNIAKFINELQKANGQAMTAVEGMDRIIMAYVNEYGEDVMTKLFEEDREYDAIVEGEIEGHDEVVRLDPQVEGDEQVPETVALPDDV